MPGRVPAFCARLKTARERRGVTLDAVSQETKVSASLFAALERGDLSRWPRGVYRRSFFRDYLAAIGLPVEPNMREFFELFPEDSASADADHRHGAPSDLRLTLARGPIWPLWNLWSAHKIARTVSRVLIVLLAALLVTRVIGGGPGTFAAAVMLCALLPALSVVERRARAAWRRGRRS